MALYLKLGHRLARLGARNGGALGRAWAAGLHLDSKKHGVGWDTNLPEGYDHTFPPAKDLPGPLWDEELTPEKRAELAAKYNLRPEDYKPRVNCGDYPDLPFEGANERDPWYDWDHARLRRNFGEPLSYDIDILDRMSPLDRRPYMVDWYQMVKVLGTIAFGITLFIYVGTFFPRFKPIAPKQYPEWYGIDDKFNGNLVVPGQLVKMGREITVNYDFPKK